jgi:hypothetical protein
MKTFKQYIEDFNNLAKGARQSFPYGQPAGDNFTPGLKSQDINIGQANLSLIGHVLHIDTQESHFSLSLTQQQLYQLQGEFQQAK